MLMVARRFEEDRTRQVKMQQPKNRFAVIVALWMPARSLLAAVAAVHPITILIRWNF